MKGVFTVNLYHDGIFVRSPLRYIQGDVKQITDIDFEGMSYEDLTEIVKRLVLGLVKRLYYCKTGCKLSLGIKELQSDSHVVEFLKLGYDNGCMVDLYVEHYDYDVMEYLNYETEEVDNEISSDEYTSDDGNEEIDDVDFFNTGEEDVVVKPMATHDEFLNRLCSNRGLFRGYVPNPPSTESNLQEEDPDGSRIDPMFKVKKGVVYPVFNPNIPWNQMEPVLGMRYEDPDQLKLALCNYAVAHGYQLWYMRNDWKAVLVFCGRNVSEGRCAGKKGNKDMVFNKNRKRKADTAESSKKRNVKNVTTKVGLKKKSNTVND